MDFPNSNPGILEVGDDTEPEESTRVLEEYRRIKEYRKNRAGLARLMRPVRTRRANQVRERHQADESSSKLRSLRQVPLTLPPQPTIRPPPAMRSGPRISETVLPIDQRPSQPFNPRLTPPLNESEPMAIRQLVTASYQSLQPARRPSVHQMFSPPTSPPASLHLSQPVQRSKPAGQNKRKAPAQKSTPPAKKQARTQTPQRQSKSPALSPTPTQQDETKVSEFIKVPDWDATVPKVCCVNPKEEEWYSSKPNTSERPGLDEEGIESYARETGMPLWYARALAVAIYNDKWQTGQDNFSCGFCFRNSSREHFAIEPPQMHVVFPDGTLDRYPPDPERDDLDKASAPICSRRACVECGVRYGLYRRDDKIKMEGNRVVWICHCKNIIPVEVDGPGLGQASCASCRRQSPLCTPNM